MDSGTYCATLSSDAGEELGGTAAAETSAWIIVELRDPWASKPIESAAFAGAPRAALDAWLAAVPGSRLQLVRQPGLNEGPLTVFLASSSPADPWLVRLSIDDIGQLPDLDVPARFQARGGPQAEELESLFLVCTHGKRDRCCAKWGMGLFTGAYALEPERVWQTTHLGGHRFAATALSLPAGFCYGRMDAADANRWMAAEERGELFNLSKLRGRTAYPAAAQYAEISLRQHLDERLVSALELRSVESVADGKWRVTFARDSDEHVIGVERINTGAESLGSCADPEPRPVWNFVAASPP